MTNTYFNAAANISANKKNKSAGIVNIIAIFCASVLAVLSLYAFLPLHGEQKIYSDLIRLHVIANSDSDYDQKLKLEVRDYILESAANLTKGCAGIDEAVEKVNAGLEDIQKQAGEFIEIRGYDYPVAVTLTKEAYPTREYAGDDGVDFILPSGKYISLRVIIGEGAGRNWWCVLFPPMCLSGSKIEDELAIAGYNSEQINILKKDKDKQYVIRFKILEMLAELFD